jgi:Flp pilus assembly protein TadB
VRAPVEEKQTSNGRLKAGDLMSEVVRDAQRLVSLEIELAQQELKELAMAYAITLAIAGAGGLLLILAVLVAVPSLIVNLVPWHWQAAAVWAGGYAVIGAVLLLVARSRFQVRLPKRTLASLKESKEWALRRVRSNNK